MYVYIYIYICIYIYIYIYTHTHIHVTHIGPGLASRGVPEVDGPRRRLRLLYWYGQFSYYLLLSLLLLLLFIPLLLLLLLLLFRALLIITTIIIIIIIIIITIITITTVSFHNFKSQNFKLSVSNPKSKYVAYLPVLSQISNCQGLGRKNKHEILKTDRKGIARRYKANI